MTKFSLLSLISALGFVAGTAQAAPPVAPYGNGWYYDISGGALWLDDVSVVGQGIDSDTGWAANAELGYALSNGLGFGVNVGYYNTELGAVSLGGRDFDIGGDVTVVPVFANIRYNLNLVGELYLNLGAGVGVAYNEIDIHSVAGFHGGNSDDSWDFGVQALGGLSYHLGDGTSIGLGYRFIHVDEIDGHLLQASLNFRW
jgi:opacity protein-like surface antigen